MKTSVNVVNNDNQMDKQNQLLLMQMKRNAVVVC